MDPSQNQSNDMGQPQPETLKEGKLDLESLDWTDVRLALLIVISAQKKAPKSRERALFITKLEEARMWAGEAMMAE